MVNICKFFFIISLCLFIMAGCEKTPEPPTDTQNITVFGFSQLGDESEWRTSSSNDIKRAANKAGIQLIFDSAQQNQFNQIKAIRSFILNRVDVIAFSPIVEEGWDNILLEAKSAGIPVILVDRYIKTEIPGLYSAFIGANFEREGYEAGKWLKRKFEKSDKPVKIVEISGTENSSPTIGRHKGFSNVIASDPKFQIVKSISGDFMRSKGMECMTNIIKETTDFDVIFAHNDDMALGAIEVLEEYYMKPGDDVMIISVDAQKSGLNALKEGKINCLIECSPYVGDTLMELVKKISNGEKTPVKTFTEVKVFTEDNNFNTLPVRP